MASYDFKVIQLTGYTADRWESDLNEAGKEGFSLVQIVTTQRGTVVYLQREQ